MPTAQDLLSQPATDYRLLSNALRVLSMDMVEHANSGHPGLPMGMADVVTVLFQDFLQFNPKDAAWPNRDRFVLSAGHGSALLYALLYVCGYPDMTTEQLKNFRQKGSLTPGHPEQGHTPGVEVTTGPLGQGIANAVGMALGEEVQRARLGADVVDHYTYVLAGDGDLMEGISHEAISFAGHHALRKLIVFFDDNNITIDGTADLAVSDHQIQRFNASNWHVQAVDGHDYGAIHKAITEAQKSNRPSLIACRTVIAKGSPNKAGTSKVHGSPLGAEEVAAVRENLGWSWEPFHVPQDILSDWRVPAVRGEKAYKAWHQRMKNSEKVCALNVETKRIKERLVQPLKSLREKMHTEKPFKATRVLSQDVLDVITPLLPELIGGSADLTPSNNTRSRHHKDITKDDFSGSYVRYGVREHGMAAIMNGLSVYGGFIPYGGTFLVFSDYLRPSLRLSALMEQPVVYVLTHDSVGLGEDGPTHQPVEHLSALRAIPGLNVFRPCDGVETLEAWEYALSQDRTPTVLALSRQNLPYLAHHRRTHEGAEGHLNTDEPGGYSAKGAYVLYHENSASSNEKNREHALTIIATGSEVQLAVEAALSLGRKGHGVRVVSAPCLNLFETQPLAMQQDILGTAPRLIIEAGTAQSWQPFIRRNCNGEAYDAFMGVESFGMSAPLGNVMEHFKLTSAHVTEKAQSLLDRAASLNNSL